MQFAVLHYNWSFDGAASAPLPDLADLKCRTRAPRAKSDIEIDYLEKILYVIFTALTALYAQSLLGGMQDT